MTAGLTDTKVLWTYKIGTVGARGAAVGRDVNGVLCGFNAKSRASAFSLGGGLEKTVVPKTVAGNPALY